MNFIDKELLSKETMNLIKLTKALFKSICRSIIKYEALIVGNFGISPNKSSYLEVMRAKRVTNDNALIRTFVWTFIMLLTLRNSSSWDEADKSRTEYSNVKLLFFGNGTIYSFAIAMYSSNQSIYNYRFLYPLLSLVDNFVTIHDNLILFPNCREIRYFPHARLICWFWNFFLAQ